MKIAPNRDVAVFAEAFEMPAAARSEFLDRSCAGDGELRRRVESMLTAYPEVGNFLEEPAPYQGRVAAAAGERLGDRIGRYKVLEQIGEGGCGVVYMAEQLEPVRRRVALKVIKPGMDTKSVIARFEAERQALALMDHPNIAKVLDAGATEAGRPFFVMELVPGIKITDYCDRNLLTTEGRLDLFIQVCHAVQHAHYKGIIHRDVKPSNILVTTSAEGKALPKVIDFGIAKATTGQKLTDKTLFTAFEMLMGTPAYMSPEQAALASVDVDTRTDIYSLGVVLYELLTSTTPFDAHNLLKAGFDEIRRVIRHQEPVRPSARLSSMTAADLTTVARRQHSEPPLLIRALQGDLDWIVMKALEKDRTRRYQTASGMAEDIQYYLANDTVSARPPGTLYRIQKLVHRNKLLFGGISIIVILLVTSLAVVTWLLTKENRARNEADTARFQAEMAQVQAEAGKRSAETEAVRSRQVTQFLEEMLQGVGPSVALGRDTTMLHEILDKTADRVGEELTNQPAVEAELQSRIGRVYWELGDYARAEAMHRLALAGYQKLYGDENLEVASSLNDLARTRMRQNDFAEAEGLYRRALVIRRKLQGAGHPDVAKALKSLAIVLLSENRLAPAEEKLAEADTLNREGLEILRKLPGDHNMDLAEYLNLMAAQLEQQGKPLEAEAKQREAVAAGRKLRGEDLLEEAIWINHLGAMVSDEGKLAEAETLERESLAIRRRLLGDQHPQTLEFLNNLLGVLVAEKKFGEAKMTFGEFLTPAFMTTPEGADVLSKRAEFFAQQGRWKEAANDAAKFIEYQPNDHVGYHMLAPLLVATHDLVNYQQLCQRILTRFAGTTNAYVADRMAKDCLILPLPGLDLQPVGELADSAVTVGNHESSAPFFRCCKALADYRQGHFSGALDWALTAVPETTPCVSAEACCVLAMAHYQLKHYDEARAALAKGKAVVDGKLPKLDSGDLGIDWRDWIIAHALLNEATALIEGPSASDSNPDKR